MKKVKKVIVYVLLLSVFMGLLSYPAVAVKAQVSLESEEKTPVYVHGQLSVDGTKVVDEHGNPFQLRGISTHGINWDIGYPYVNKEAFKELRDEWGANAIRLAMYTAEYNGYCEGGNQTELKNIIKNGVDYAKELGMYAIIDWHVLNDNTPLKYIDNAKSFWQEISLQYKDYNNVLYEICNEPNGCSWDDIKSYANTIIPIIRANDPDAIIIVGTPTWSQLGMQGHTNEVADSPLTGYSNIVYALHFYCAESSHSQYLPAKVDYAVNKGIAVLVSEFGMSEASGNGNISAEQGVKWFEKLDDYGIGYFCWSLSNKNETSALIASWCTKTSGWEESELTDAGKFIKEQYLLRKEVFTDDPDTPRNEDLVAFVTRLYTLVLNRTADISEVNDWVDRLVSKEHNGFSVGYGFVFSDECVNRNLSNEEFVKIMYRTYLGREADADGLNTWTDMLNAGMDREVIFYGFAMSDEFNGICKTYGIDVGSTDSIVGFSDKLNAYKNQKINVNKFVIRCYEKALGRSYDTDGLENWCKLIITGEKTPKQVATDGFFNSTEFINKNLSNTEYVKVLYRTFLGREYDDGGLAVWVNLLDTNSMTRNEVLNGFADSDEFAKILESFI
ncbi:MAG: cellulase family glycosylhydrolase [Lachnospiraceae bacterium]